MKPRGHQFARIGTQALLGLLVALTYPISAQASDETLSLTTKGIELFKAADYPGAIECLERALVTDPEDADAYYYLGYFTHYLCYDSVPLTGFDRQKSNDVLRYLQKAVDLDPGHGNAYYFIGAEYGARALAEMQLGNREAIAEQYRLGHQAGGFPPWMIEAGRNTLRSCDRDAILFLGGDADANPVLYLQFVEEYRRDVTVIPVGLLDRPWFVRLLKDGGNGTIVPAPISWSDQQISSMRPYKWKANTVGCTVSGAVQLEYGIERNAVEWELAPDLGRGETLDLLSTARASFADIILTNSWERPVHFSLWYAGGVESGLHDHLQLHGFTQRLLPYVPGSNIDADAANRTLLDPDAFRQVASYSSHPLPRAAVLLQGYRTAFMRLIYHYMQVGEDELAAKVFSAMDNFVDPNLIPVADNHRASVNAFREKLFPSTDDAP